VKIVVPVRLYPAATDEAALRDTLALCNQAAGLVSARAFATGVTSKLSLQRLVYGDLKAMGLSAQPAIHVARKVAGAYAALRANIRAGKLGEPESKRRGERRVQADRVPGGRRAALR
jgi:putative transposase